MRDERQNHFDRLYGTNPDPWDYATSPYEQQKYAATLAALQRPHYDSAIEVGCSIGVLSAGLHRRCDRFLGLDLSATALQLARRRLGHRSNVALRQVDVPHQWPRRSADLIMLSEVLYYLDPDELSTLAARIDRWLVPGGEVVIVSFRGDTDTPLSGLAASGLFIRALRRLRPFRGMIHPTKKDYLHRTLLCAAGGLGKPLVADARSEETLPLACSR